MFETNKTKKSETKVQLLIITYLGYDGRMSSASSTMLSNDLIRVNDDYTAEASVLRYKWLNWEYVNQYTLTFHFKFEVFRSFAELRTTMLEARSVLISPENPDALNAVLTLDLDVPLAIVTSGECTCPACAIRLLTKMREISQDREMVYIMVPTSKVSEEPTLPESEWKEIVGKSAMRDVPEDTQCAICMCSREENYSKEDWITLECGHAFHTHCIHKQLTEYKSECPVCRRKISSSHDVISGR